MTERTSQGDSRDAASPLKSPIDDDFFGFSRIPFDSRDFTFVQTDLFEKVERALISMEEDLHDKEPEEKELLSRVMKISAWRNLRECLGASLGSVAGRDDLVKYINECATIFYKELDHPYWSTTQFQYLLHLDSSNPAYWSGYALCLLQMSERGFMEEFRLDEKAAIAFLQAARLSMAHIIAKTAHGVHHTEEKLIERAILYYGNAKELGLTAEGEQGSRLAQLLKERSDLRNRDSLMFAEEGFREEISHVLNCALGE
jgi:hypothetical protein